MYVDHRICSPHPDSDAGPEPTRGLNKSCKGVVREKDHADPTGHSLSLPD